jgi:hypothetical protein
VACIEGRWHFARAGRRKNVLGICDRIGLSSLWLKSPNSIRGATVSETLSDRRLLKRERVTGRNYDLFEASNRIEMMVDGSSGMLLGPAVSRIDFHKVVSAEPGSDTMGEVLEVRERHLSIVIPTPQLIEFLFANIKSLTQNKAALLDGMNLQIDAIKKLMDNLEIKD